MTNLPSEIKRLIRYAERTGGPLPELAEQGRRWIEDRQVNARRAIEVAADGGSAVAMCLLAAGMQPTDPESLRLLQRASDLGFAPALQLLAYRYELGMGVAPDLGEARRLYEEAAEQGYTLAATRLADSLAEGRLGVHDMKRAIELASLAAEGGDSTAAMLLAEWYEKGKCLSVDQNMALTWYERSAHMGNPLACLRLSFAYLAGDLGLQIDKTKSQQYRELTDRSEFE